jgi:hypothetical protein
MSKIDLDVSSSLIPVDNFTIYINRSVYVNGQLDDFGAWGKSETNLIFVPGSAWPTLPVASFSLFPQHVAHPTSVMPYTCTILALGANLAYNCCCMPSVAHEPPTNIRRRDCNFESGALESAIMIGGTVTVWVIL